MSTFGVSHTAILPAASAAALRLPALCTILATATATTPTTPTPTPTPTTTTLSPPGATPQVFLIGFVHGCSLFSNALGHGRH